jgi:hypothetical protein
VAFVALSEMEKRSRLVMIEMVIAMLWVMAIVIEIVMAIEMVV